MMTFRQWVETNDITDLPDVVYRYAEAAWQAAQAEQANIIKELRYERDALLDGAGILVDYDFGHNGWNPKLDSAAMRMRMLVAKMREDYGDV